MQLGTIQLQCPAHKYEHKKGMKQAGLRQGCTLELHCLLTAALPSKYRDNLPYAASCFPLGPRAQDSTQ